MFLLITVVVLGVIASYCIFKIAEHYIDYSAKETKIQQEVEKRVKQQLDKEKKESSKDE